MIGNNEMHLNMATMIEALQLWIDDMHERKLPTVAYPFGNGPLETVAMQESAKALWEPCEPDAGWRARRDFEHGDWGLSKRLDEEMRHLYGLSDQVAAANEWKRLADRWAGHFGAMQQAIDYGAWNEGPPWLVQAPQTP
jgi:hypothetical protein